MDSTSEHRSALPMLKHQEFFLADSGLETDLIFHQGIDLPDSAAFVLVDEDSGREALRRYYSEHIGIAVRAGTGIVLESPTWRASTDWGERLGYEPERLDEVNRAAIDLMVEVRAGSGVPPVPVLISGCVGPRGDGYRPDSRLTPSQSERYHSAQLKSFAKTAADLATAMTITHTGEAIGIVRAAEAADLPVVISFTVETDGRLPDGTPLGEAINSVDDATDRTACYFMVNCAHPSHIESGLHADETWSPRLRGLRAHASRLSHAELGEAEELDDGDPRELAADCIRLRERMPSLMVLGGCCGTDARHIDAIAAACVA